MDEKTTLDEVGSLDRDEAIRRYTKAKFNKDGELEIDDDAVVSEGEDNGAYVQGWVWVSFAGTDLCKGNDGKHEDCEEGCPVLEELREKEV
jgi:hypothetical protein